MCTFFSLKEKIPSWSHFQLHLYHFSHVEFVLIKVWRDVESFIPQISRVKGFPGSSVGKKSTCNAGDMGLIPGSERAPGEENGYSLQYSCLGNPMDREAWQATVHGVSRVRHNLVTKPLPLESKPFFQVTFSIHDYRISTSNSSLKFHTKLNVLVKKSGFNKTVSSQSSQPHWFSYNNEAYSCLMFWREPWDVPGSLTVKTLCMGHRSHSQSWNQYPSCLKAKRKKKNVLSFVIEGNPPTISPQLRSWSKMRAYLHLSMSGLAEWAERAMMREPSGGDVCLLFVFSALFHASFSYQHSP